MCTLLTSSCKYFSYTMLSIVVERSLIYIRASLLIVSVRCPSNSRSFTPAIRLTGNFLSVRKGSYFSRCDFNNHIRESSVTLFPSLLSVKHFFRSFKEIINFLCIIISRQNDLFTSCLFSTCLYG